MEAFSQIAKSTKSLPQMLEITGSNLLKSTVQKYPRGGATYLELTHGKVWADYGWHLADKVWPINAHTGRLHLAQNILKNLWTPGFKNEGLSELILSRLETDQQLNLIMVRARSGQIIKKKEIRKQLKNWHLNFWKSLTIFHSMVLQRHLNSSTKSKRKGKSEEKSA